MSVLFEFPYLSNIKQAKNENARKRLKTIVYYNKDI